MIKKCTLECEFSCIFPDNDLNTILECRFYMCKYNPQDIVNSLEDTEYEDISDVIRELCGRLI